MAGATTFKIIFAGDTKGLDQATKKVGQGLGGLSKLALGAGVAAGAAVGGLSAFGVKQFIGFQDQMNEVFTLLPGISEEAMGEMSDQVKGFSKQFGVLPDKVVPALYQALSAGVPPGNVFDFLATSQKAAKGGVTELTTAVDGITSVVNAYGSDVLSATEASDLMFTAVKLGKTNMEELSSSLFNVVPTAASMGIGFDQVTAAMARLTAQGTPTSVATTQLRALFVGAAKDGSDLDLAIRDLSGKSFTQLVREGKGPIEIFQDLRKNMPDDEFRNLFGRVEGLNAALGLTGPQADEFNDALGEMQNAAGATNEAYGRMSSGLRMSIDKIKANFQVLALEVGEKVAPALATLLDLILGRGIPALGNLADKVRDLKDRYQPLIDRIHELADEALGRLVEMAQEASSWLKEHEEVARALAVGGLTVLGVAFGALAISAGTAAVAMIAAAAPVIAIGLAVGALGAGIYLLIQHWDDLTERYPIIQEAADKVTEAFREFVAWIQSDLLPALENMRIAAVTAFKAVVGWVTDHWSDISAIVKPVIDQVILILETMGSVFRDLVAGIVDIIQGDWSGAWENAKQILGAFKDYFTGSWNNLVEFLKTVVPLLLDAGKAAIKALWDGASEFWTGTLWPWIQGLPAQIGEAIATVAPKLLFNAGAEIIQGLIDGMWSLKDKIPNPIDWIPGKGILDSLTGGLFGSGSAGALGTQFGGRGGAGAVGTQFGVPQFAAGGIVTRPMLAMVGEAGPEAVIPLPRAGVAAGGITVHVHGSVYGVDDLARELDLALKRSGAGGLF